MIKTFEHELFGQIRTALQDESIYFNLFDAGMALGYSRNNGKGSILLRKDKLSDICKTLDINGVTLGDTHNIYAINKEIDFENTYIAEEYLYDLIFESKAKNARSFRKWVTSEVLPTIRRDGMYISDDATHEQVKFNPDVFMSNLDDYNITKLYDLISEFLSFHRKKKTRLAYKRTHKSRHGNKTLKNHIESMEELRDTLVHYLNIKIKSFNDSNQAGLAQEYIRIREMVRVSVENMRYRTAACK
ncbi:Bro-N domain-containing protein [Paenibacillus sp. EKM208P]|nr:Bro-N domain-containing protein [Paenibacillus sp. EKM208P]